MINALPDSAVGVMSRFGYMATMATGYEREFILHKVWRNGYFFRFGDKHHPENGWCSKCRDDADARGDLQQNGLVTCQMCGAELEVRDVKRGLGNLQDEALTYFFYWSEGYQQIVARAVYARRIWGMYLDPREAEADYMVDSMYVYSLGRGCRSVRPVGGRRIENSWYGNPATYEFVNGQASRAGAYSRVEIDKESLVRAVKDTPLRYLPWERITERGCKFALKILEMSVANPSAVEILLKMGLWKVMDQITERENIGRVINWKGKTVAQVLRFNPTREDKRYMLLHDMSWFSLGIWQTGRRNGRLLAMEEAAKISKGLYSVEEAREVDAAVGLRKAESYAERMAIRGREFSWRIYLDYLQECKELGLDMKEKENAFPVDLRRVHERTMVAASYKKNEMLEAMYKKRRAGLVRKYSFAAGGMVMVVPARAADLILEGEHMHNCVGGYMEKLAKGVTDILFLRREQAAKDSFVTVEVRDGKILQAYAACNQPIDAAAREFLNKFKEKVLEKKGRKTA